MPTQAASSTNTTDAMVLGDTTLEPGQEKSLVLGLYEEDFPQPELQLDVTPQSCTISSSLERASDEDGEYRLTYHLRNSQNTPCLVTVRQLA